MILTSLLAQGFQCARTPDVVGSEFRLGSNAFS